jgi:hypothetical protein
MNTNHYSNYRMCCQFKTSVTRDFYMFLVRLIVLENKLQFMYKYLRHMDLGLQGAGISHHSRH